MNKNNNFWKRIADAVDSSLAELDEEEELPYPFKDDNQLRGRVRTIEEEIREDARVRVLRASDS